MKKKKTMTKIESRVLASIFKNIPIELWKEVAKFKTKGKREYSVSIHGREPLPGKKYGWGGALKRENATAADLYVDMTKYHIVREKYKEIADLNDQLYELEQKYDRLLETFKILDRRGDKERRCRSPF